MTNKSISNSDGGAAVLASTASTPPTAKIHSGAPSVPAISLQPRTKTVTPAETSSASEEEKRPLVKTEATETTVKRQVSPQRTLPKAEGGSSSSSVLEYKTYRSPDREFPGPCKSGPNEEGVSVVSHSAAGSPASKLSDKDQVRVVREAYD